MDNRKSLIPREFALIVLGALNVNSADRKLEVSESEPVRVLIDDELKTVKFFYEWNTIGVSSIAWPANDPMSLFITKGENEITRIIKLSLKTSGVQMMDIDHLGDVHEMIIFDRMLWIANTRFDEAVAFDIEKCQVRERISLSSFRGDKNNGDDGGDNQTERVDKFHLNQVFKNMDGELYGLVHHITGRQIIRHLGDKKIKTQGNGGIIHLRNGNAIALGLKSPHTVRIVNGNYWIMDSGHFKINIYDYNWRLKDVLNTRGYGRGADSLEANGVFFAGISAIRKRYLKMIPSNHPNMVQLIDIASKKTISELIIETGIEQVNNVYVVNRKVGEALLSLK